MKKRIVLCGAVIALMLGAYAVMGLVTEMTLKKTVGLLTPSRGVWVEVSSYQRGWFHSKALLVWKITVPKHVITQQDDMVVSVPEKTYAIPMPISIQHGPMMLSSKALRFGFGDASTTLTLPKQYVALFHKTYTDNSIQPTLTLRFFVNFLNQAHVKVSVPAFKLMSKVENEHFDWLGMTSDITFSSRGQRVHGAVHLQGLQGKNQQLGFDLGAIEGHYDLRHTASGLYFGHVKAMASSLLMNDSQHTVLSIDHVVFDSTSDVVEDLFHSHSNVALKSMKVNDQIYGPWRADFSMKNLDVQALLKLNQALKTLQQTSQVDRQRLLWTLLPELPGLLNKGAQFDVSHLNLILPEGRVEGSMQWLFPRETMSNPFQFYKKMTGTLHLTLGTEVLKSWLYTTSLRSLTASTSATETQNPLWIKAQATLKASNKLANWRHQGVFIETDHTETIDLKLKDGHLLVNNHPFHASML